MKRSTAFYAGGAILVLLSLYYVYTNALHYFDFTRPGNGFDANPFRPFLIVHITAGIIAILTGPLQFISAIRNRYVRWHRIQGAIYLIAVLIGASSGMYLAIAHNILAAHRYTFGSGLAGLSLAWFLTSGMAFLAIKNRHIGQHTAWMIKSYVVTCGFTTFRFIGDLVNSSFPINPGETIGIMAWACWAVPLLLTEVILQFAKITSPKPHALKYANVLSSVLK